MNEELLFTMDHPKKYLREHGDKLYVYKVVDEEIYDTPDAVYVARTRRAWGMGFHDWDADLGVLVESIAKRWQR